jgi:hypothetical protein
MSTNVRTKLKAVSIASVSSGLAVACALFMGILMALRISSAVSFERPLQLVTSGYEQESLLAIWEALHVHAIYVSRWEPPFRWAIYNWLYYDTYTAIAKAAMASFDLETPWLPTVTRLTTIAGMIAGVVITYATYSVALGPSKSTPKVEMAALAVLVSAGPLVGYWGLTTRPDVWALTIEIAALGSFLALYNTRPIAAVLLFCVLAYVAWSFKQSNVTALGGVGLFLLYRRRWGLLALLSATTVGAWAATLGLGPEIFRKSVLLSEYDSTNTTTNALRIFTTILPKIIPPLVGLMACTWALARNPAVRRGLGADDTLVIACGGTFIGMMIAFLTSRQPGAAENYYFVPVFFVTLAFLAMRRRLVTSSEYPHAIAVTLALSWGLQAIAVAAVVFGLTATTSVRKFDAYHRAAKACLDELPRPLFVDNHYLSLPWMTPGNPSYVLAFGYREDRIAGRNSYQGDGIGGRISRGDFAALAFTNDPGGAYDGAPLTRYRRVASDCPDLFVYLRETKP